MSKHFAKAIGVLAASVVLFSCQRDKTAMVKPDQQNESAINKKWNESVPKVAGIVTSLLKTKEFRDYLKGKVLEAFDGDYDVLLSTVVKDLKNGLTTGNTRTAQTMVTDPNQLSYLQGVAGDFPQMQLSVQVDPNDWNTGTYTPPVVYTDASYNETTTFQVPVVNEYGATVSYMDATVDPTQPVVIVTQNERTIIGPNGEVTLEQPPGPDGISYDNLRTDSLLPIDPNVPLQWYRQNFKYETIYAIRFDNIGRIEGWPAGGPELRTYHYSASDTVGLVYQKEGYYAGERWAKRKDIKNKWYLLPNEKLITTHLWRWGQTGTTAKYAFYEWDSEPLNQAVADSLSSFLTKFAKLDTTGQISAPIQVAAAAVKLVGLFLPKEGRLSETIGDLEISVNNNADEFHLATGGFSWKSKPY